jgi:Family of unknown function (DUF6283)
LSPAAPCSTCPWRKSSTLGGYDIPGFDLEKMRGLSCTVSGPGEREDAFRVIMACHGCEEGSEGICRGYAYVEGWTNINVRLMSAQGRLDMAAIDTACEGLDLWDSFWEMLEAYEEARYE